jgi:hypothetical protein
MGLGSINLLTGIRPEILRDYMTAIKFEVFTAVTIKNGVFWDFTPC